MKKQVKRGRPPKPLLTDIDRYAVALMHAFRTKIRKNGKFPSVWRAACLTAICFEYEIVDVNLLSRARNTGLSPMMRRLPVRNKPAEEFIEYSFEAFKHNPYGARTYDALARRISSKYKRWTTPGTPESVWLESMADAWCVTLHPKEAFRAGLSPDRVCRIAAARADELEFAEKILIPRLVGALNRPGS